MKKLNTEEYLRCAIAAKSVFRALEQTDSTITYQQLAEAIGLKDKNEPWHASHKTNIGEVIKLLAAAERQVHDELSPFHRVINAGTGKPGSGFYTRETRLVNCKAE